MRCARVIVGTRALEAQGAVGVIVGVAGAGAGSRHQSLVVGERVPVQMGKPALWMVTLVAVKVAVQPSSHSWPMETREPEARLGKTWALQALGEREGRDKRAVWLDCIRLPSGRRTAMPGCVGWMLVHVASVLVQFCFSLKLNRN